MRKITGQSDIPKRTDSPGGWSALSCWLFGPCLYWKLISLAKVLRRGDFSFLFCPGQWVGAVTWPDSPSPWVVCSWVDCVGVGHLSPKLALFVIRWHLVLYLRFCYFISFVFKLVQDSVRKKESFFSLSQNPTNSANDLLCKLSQTALYLCFSTSRLEL